MSQAEELLASLSEGVHIHEHPVVDPDTYFVIDPDTREITNEYRRKHVIMQYDHDSERYTFELPRYVEGHDMMLCNSVLVHWNNIDGETGEETAECSDIDDLHINPVNEGTVLCSWLISRNSTQRVGILSFAVQYKCVDDDGVDTYEWHTDIYEDVEVRKSLINSERSIIDYTDILEQWRVKLFGEANSAVSSIAELSDETLAAVKTEGEAQISAINSAGETQVKTITETGNEKLAAITAEGEKQVAAVIAEGDVQKEAIVLKGAETLATIPEDYTTTYNMAEEALRKKANAIELEAAGESIFVNDSSDAHLLGLNICGRTTQFTTTGKQLFDANSATNFTPDENGWYTWTRDNTENDMPYYYQLNHPTSNLLKPNTDYLVVLEIDSNSNVGFELVSSHNSLSQFATNVYYNPSKSTKGTHVSIATTASDFSSATTMLRTVVNVDAGLVGSVKFRISVYEDISVTANTFEYEPYTGGMPSPSPEYPQELESVANPVVSVYGKNLYSMGDIVLNGNSRADVIFTGPVKLPVTLSWTQDFDRTSGSALFGYTVDNVEYYSAASEFAGRYEVPITKGDILEQIMILNWVPETGNITDIQIELGSTATDYEPYKPVQTLTINHAIPAIPVTEGGNYTDVNGQQWICDEIDFERGVYVHRTKRMDLRSLKTWNTWGVNSSTEGITGFYHYPNLAFTAYEVMCTIGTSGPMVWGGRNVGAAAAADYVMIAVYNNLLADTSTDEAAKESFVELIDRVGGEIVAAIPPVEAPLTEEEIAYYKQLKTNYHNTTVMNDHNARMAIKYAADTLIYLRDNQPVPTDEQVQNAVNEYAIQNGVQVPSDDHIRVIVDEALGGIVNDEY